MSQSQLPRAEVGDEIDIRKWLSLLWQHKLLGFMVAALVCVCGWYRLFLQPPVYFTDALVQVGQKRSSLWSGSSDVMLGYPYFDGQPEIDVMSSRTVLGHAVLNSHLEISAQPRYFPVYGAALVRHGLGGIFQYLGGKYAWTDTSINVGQLEVPPGLVGVAFNLKTGVAGHYVLSGPDGKPLLTGEVGKSATVVLSGGNLSLLVDELNAKPGVEFIVISRRPKDVVMELQGHLDIAMKNKQSTMIQLVMRGQDPQWITKALNAVLDAYIQQNVALHSEEASKSIDFLSEQLPNIKAQLVTAEGALQSYKTRQGGVIDVGAEGKSILDQAKVVDTKISDLKLQRSELKFRFTDDSPAIKALDQQLGQLDRERDRIDGQMKKVPQAELETIRLMREVQGTAELYTRLQNRFQELKVTKAGAVGDARVVDVAIVPGFAVAPNFAKSNVLILLFALAAGLGAIFIKVVLRRSLDTPDTIENELGLAVFATIPHSDLERGAARSTDDGHVLKLLCRVAPDEPAVEGLRSLRTSLQFASLEAKNNIVAIHGPTPGIGKSFVATNLASLLADTHKSTLLIDADMRKGHAHKALGTERSPGLSEVISGACPLLDAIHPIDGTTLKFMPTGKLPPNPAELLAHGSFAALLHSASEAFDFVIVDTPPTLNLADSISIGRQAGVNFLVVRGGLSTLQDIRIAQRRMEQNGIRIDGIIFNGLSVMATRYGYGDYYSYKYKPERSD